MIRTLVAVAAIAGLAVPAADAMVVRNLDKALVTVTFTPTGGQAESKDLKPHHYWTFDCSKGGEVAVGKEKAACTAKTKKVMIKAGKPVV